MRLDLYSKVRQSRGEKQQSMKVRSVFMFSLTQPWCCVEEKEEEEKKCHYTILTSRNNTHFSARLLSPLLYLLCMVDPA